MLQSSSQLEIIFIGSNSNKKQKMKAIYKHHCGFQHLNTLNTINANIYSNAHSNFNNNPVLYEKPNIGMSGKYVPAQDTSTKKYPNNKYYQFDDENSSGRKYLKQKLNLYPDQTHQYKQQQNSPKNQESSSRYSKLDDDIRKSKKAVSFSMCVNDYSHINDNNSEQYENKKQSKTLKQQKMSLNQKMKNTKYEEYKRFFNPKQNQGNNSKSSKPSSKSVSKLKNNKKKVSTSISTIQSKSRKCHKSHINSSRYVSNEETEQNYVNQLKHYKKLCLSMRKKNCELAKQLLQCKQQNRNQIGELQRKIQKISQKYIQKKQHIDNDKTTKIIESLKTIKGKLSQKQSNQDKQTKKFYQFFVQSLDILKSQTNQKYTPLQVKIIWKHMLQFLINNGYKIGENYKVKTIR